MSVEAKIQDAAARNAELVHALHETESAVPDLAAQRLYVADLERQAAEAAERLRQLGERRKRELREHESYRDSVMRRFAYKIGGREDKFAERAAREEREYFDALQEEQQAGVMARNLDAMLGDARAARDELEGRAAAHEMAKRELDGLYEAIFTGPTPGFPEEDERERDVQAALLDYHAARSHAEGEAQAIKILSRARDHLNLALMSMEDALHASRKDMLGRGTFHDMLERNALAKAENEIQQARKMVTMAKRTAPLVRDLPQVSIAKGMLGDVFFDNYLSDKAFHEKIEQSNMEVQRCAQVLKDDLAAAKKRHAEVSRETDQKRAEVRRTRSRLQKAREAAFERIAGQAHAPIRPPGITTESWWE